MVENVWEEELRKLPDKPASRMQKRYPTTPEGMSNFLRSLYPRHFLQVTQSLSDEVNDPSFQEALREDEFNIIDIGSGPAVASLAVTDLVIQQLPKSHAARAEVGKVTCLDQPFPQSFQRIHEIRSEGFRYDFLCVGYLLAPVNENLDLSRSAHCVASMKQFSHPSGGRFLLLQDKFHEELAQQVSHLIGSRLERFSSRQRAYANRDKEAVGTYTCFRCQSVS